MKEYIDDIITQKFHYKILEAFDELMAALNINSNLLERYLKSFEVSNSIEKTSIFLKIIQRGIYQIDVLLSNQVNQLLHANEFQSLEASWRGLKYLVDQNTLNTKIKIKLLDVSWDLLSKDLNYSLDFDQSQIFKKIYDQQLDTPGGEPFGLLIGDYYIDHRGVSNDGIKHLDTIESMAKISSFSFVPFVTAANSSLFEVESFATLYPWLDVENTFKQEQYAKYRSFVAKKESRFVGLVLPKVLMRPTYQANAACTQAFNFAEKALRHHEYLWGNAVYYFASVVIRSYESSGWFYDIVGTDTNKTHNGLIKDLLQQSFDLDRQGLLNCIGLEHLISESQEQKLSGMGFIALTSRKYTNDAAFYSCSSVHAQKFKSNDHEFINDKTFSKLNHILCVSRFAHYIKIIMREKIGLFISPQECENYLQQWINNYTATLDEGSHQQRITYPLRAASVAVRRRVDNPQSYICDMYLCPHLQIDEFNLQIRFTANI